MCVCVCSVHVFIGANMYNEFMCGVHVCGMCGAHIHALYRQVMILDINPARHMLVCTYVSPCSLIINVILWKSTIYSAVGTYVF